jgi:hypothetical protein
MRLTTVDVPEPEFVVNQATFYLTLLITIGSAGAIIAQTIRGINNRIQRNKVEANERAKAAEDAVRKYIEDRMKEVDEVKQRVDFIYWRIVERFFEDEQRGELQQSKKNGTTNSNKKG